MHAGATTTPPAWWYMSQARETLAPCHPALCQLKMTQSSLILLWQLLFNEQWCVWHNPTYHFYVCTNISLSMCLEVSPKGRMMFWSFDLINFSDAHWGCRCVLVGSVFHLLLHMFPLSIWRRPLQARKNNVLTHTRESTQMNTQVTNTHM